jgi:hypothetical protein
MFPLQHSQIPKEEKDPVKYVSMFIPSLHKLPMVLYVFVVTHGHTPSVNEDLKGKRTGEEGVKGKRHTCSAP